jgi:voltage-gated potassium channel
VTITTVGYGDFFPVTTLGRLTGVAVMFAGVGIIGALASILASILVPDAPAPAPEPEADATVGRGPAPSTDPAASPTAVTSSIESELSALRAEIEALRRSLAPDRGGASG